MEISIDPRPDQLQSALASIPQNQPVVMLNLLKFKARAEYRQPQSGDNTDITGQQAYAIYAEQALTFLKEVGAEVIWHGSARASLIAPAGEDWDQVLLVKYPDIAHFTQMVMNPDYQAITRHRSAALANSRLIATQEQV